MARRVIVLYNTDYDEELIAEDDVSAVRESASAITDAVADYGLDSQLMGIHGLELGAVMSEIRAQAPDLVFNLCESLNGDTRNEMVIPSVLDMIGVPYTGTGSLGLGSCLHKERCKQVLRAEDIDTPESVMLRSEAHVQRLAGNEGRALDGLSYPYFLKLAREDASIGIDERNVVEDRAAMLLRARQLLDKYNQAIVAERYIIGREVNVTLLGNGCDMTTLPLHEIDFQSMPAGRPHIVSYAAKWDESHVDYAGTKPVLMDNVPEALASRIRSVAQHAYAALGLKDYGRVDVRVDETGRPWVIDVNPNCDLSPDAGVARAAAFQGMPYPELIGRICELAWARYAS